MAKIARGYLTCGRVLGVLQICLGVGVSIIAVVFNSACNLTFYTNDGSTQSALTTYSAWIEITVSIFICLFALRSWHINRGLSIPYYVLLKAFVLFLIRPRFVRQCSASSLLFSWLLNTRTTLL